MNRTWVIPGRRHDCDVRGNAGRLRTLGVGIKLLVEMNASEQAIGTLCTEGVMADRPGFIIRRAAR